MGGGRKSKLVEFCWYLYYKIKSYKKKSILNIDFKLNDFIAKFYNTSIALEKKVCYINSVDKSLNRKLSSCLQIYDGEDIK